MIRRLLLSRQKPWQLLLSSFGAFMGILLVLFTLQSYLDFKELMNDKSDWLHPEYLTINKKISVLASLGEAEGFDQKEIEDLKKLEGVEHVAPFRSNLFRASGMNMPGGASLNRELYAELFFESIPDEMLDQEKGSFSWEPGDELIPILIPADYLKLYNFGFAPSQGMPQVSPKTLSSIPFRIIMDSMGTTVKKNARIVSYSQRIQSILVPDAFLAYANANYTKADPEKKPSRLIVQVKDPSNTALLRYLDEHNYESNEEQLRNSRLSNVLKIISSILAAVAGLIIFLSFLGFFQYAQLVLYRNQYEIRTLLDLGMAPARLFGVYLKMIGFVILGIGIGSLAALIFILRMMQERMEEYGLELAGTLRVEVLLGALLIFVLFFVIQAIGLRKGIYGLMP